MFGRTKGLLVISKFCFGGMKDVLLYEIFVPPEGGGGGAPLSIKSSIVGREGCGLSSPYLFKSIFVPPVLGGPPPPGLLFKKLSLLSLILSSLFLISIYLPG